MDGWRDENTLLLPVDSTADLNFEKQKENNVWKVALNFTFLNRAPRSLEVMDVKEQATVVLVHGVFPEEAGFQLGTVLIRFEHNHVTT